MVTADVDAVIKTFKERLAAHYANPVEHKHIWEVVDFTGKPFPWYCSCREVKNE